MRVCPTKPVISSKCAVGGVSSSPTSFTFGTGQSSSRVTLSCPEKGDTAGKLVLLPGSIAELLDVGYQKFGFRAAKIMTKDGFSIEDLAVVRDGDHLILAGAEMPTFSFI